MEDRLVEVAELAPSFRDLIERVVVEGEEELSRRANETDAENK
jgi:hypothetical protein